MNKILDSIKDDVKQDIPSFRAGDTVSVGVKVIEGEKSRVQVFKGLVIAISAGSGMSKTFTVRKISNGIGVERIFPLHSPLLSSINVKRRGKVRRAKLNYLKNITGLKAARIEEKR